jgi:tetratricopeptide (TPR) repeat protein
MKLVALTELQRCEEALAVAETALASAPELALAWQSKGVLLLKLQRPAEAVEALDRALTVDDRLPSAWIHKGAALLQLDLPQEATAAFDRALELLPKDAMALRGKRQARAMRTRDVLGRHGEVGLRVLLEILGRWPGSGH